MCPGVSKGFSAVPEYFIGFRKRKLKGVREAFREVSGGGEFKAFQGTSSVIGGKCRIGIS